MRSPAGQEPCGGSEGGAGPGFWIGETMERTDVTGSTGVFGSGWAWLVSDQDGTLMVLTTANQDVPDLKLYTSIFPIDVWEHAYYLQYHKMPMSHRCEIVVDKVYERIQDAEIWIPYGEVYRYYIKRKTKIIQQESKRKLNQSDQSE